MPRRRLYCPLCQKYCKQSTRDGETAGCTYTDKHLDLYNECVKDIIYKDRHKVEIWLQENGWIQRHLNFRGTCWRKEDFQLIVDYGGIAIRTSGNIIHETRVRTKEQLQDVLAPYLLPAWLIDEFTIKLKPIIKKTEKEDTLPYVLQTEM